MTKEELQDYLIDEAEYDSEDVMLMSDEELFSKYLEWNGIIGYANEIIDIVRNLNFN